MPLDTFAATRAKAIIQLNPRHMIHCDKDTMKLMCQLLNEHYAGDDVHFTVLDGESLPDGFWPFTHKDKAQVQIFVFHQHDSIWSAAWIDRVNRQVSLFDGITSTLSDVATDMDRRARLEALNTKLDEPQYVSAFSLPELSMSVKEAPQVCYSNGVYSASVCLAWAETYHNGWAVHPKVPCAPGQNYEVWEPKTNELVPWGKPSRNGTVPWAKMLIERAKLARYRPLSG
jgi:hypothetical protein